MAVERHDMLARAAHMRREPTPAEQRLWSLLRGSRLDGYKFRRQAVIGERIADFFCPAKGLIVEIDGWTHDAAQDARRDGLMRDDRGFETMRFTNSEVMDNPEGVLGAIRAVLAALPDRWERGTIPDPSSEEEGRE